MRLELPPQSKIMILHQWVDVLRWMDNCFAWIRLQMTLSKLAIDNRLTVSGVPQQQPSANRNNTIGGRRAGWWSGVSTTQQYCAWGDICECMTIIGESSHLCLKTLTFL